MPAIYDEETFFHQYAQMSRSREGLSGAGEWPQFRALFPCLKGKSVLDLGCGYGWHSRYAAESGAAKVLGIDASQKMLDYAQKFNAQENIEYRLCTVEEYGYPQASFDCVISNLVLHYVRELAPVFQKIFACLKPGGVFLLNIEHPVFTGSAGQRWIEGENGEKYWPVDRYFEPGPRTMDFLGCPVVKQHHTLTQILMGLLDAGFSLEAVEEAVPPKEWMALPGMEDELRRPMMLLIRAVRPCAPQCTHDSNLLSI